MTTDQASKILPFRKARGSEQVTPQEPARPTRLSSIVEYRARKVAGGNPWRFAAELLEQRIRQGGYRRKKGATTVNHWARARKLMQQRRQRQGV